jgi:hypothetical protein
VHQAFADDPEILTRSEEADSRLKQITLMPRTGSGAIPNKV